MATADEYAKWIVENSDKRGTPEFDTVAQAYQLAKKDEAPKDKPAGQRLNDLIGDTSLSNLGRQLGLTARYGIQGLGDVADLISSPVRVALNKAGMNIQGRTGESIADMIGLPSPQTTQEKVVGKGSEFLAASAVPLAKAASSLRGVNPSMPTDFLPAGQRVARAFSQSPGSQVASAAGAGVSGEYIKETGGNPAAQFVASVAGGIAAPAALAAGRSVVNASTNAVKSLRPDPQKIEVLLQQTIDNGDMGFVWADVGNRVKAQLRDDVQSVLSVGGKLDADALRRLVDYRMIGATPTRAGVTLNPVDVTRQRNLSKMGANTSDASLQELANIENANNKQLISGLNDMGAGKASALDAGRSVTGLIQSRDAAARGVEKGLYGRAQGLAGRQIPLDREAFVTDAYRRLAESNKGAYLPKEIESLLASIRTGKSSIGGREFDVPFNVDTIDNLKTTLATASRATKDGNVRYAISNVRDALENAPIVAQGRGVGGNQATPAGLMQKMQGQADDLSQQAMNALDKARRFSRARHQWQESSAGVKAALDDAAPDSFIENFILGKGDKASVMEVAKLKHQIGRSPETLQHVKDSIVGWLKGKAVNIAEDETANFSQSAYNRALKQLGDEKLRLFFSAEEISQLKAIGRVASYEQFQPRGSAVNNSNSGAMALGNVLDWVANNQLLSRVPLADTMLRTPAKNWSTQIQINQAKNASAGLLMPPPKQDPQIPIGLLMPFGYSTTQ